MKDQCRNKKPVNADFAERKKLQEGYVHEGYMLCPKGPSTQ